MKIKRTRHYLLSGLLMLSTLNASADIISDANTVFSWAEQTFPTLLTPTQSTKSTGDWLYRDYLNADILVGIYKPDNGVYYISGKALVRGDKPTYYDSVPNLLKLASAKAPVKPDNFQSLVGTWVLEKTTSSGIDKSGKPFDLTIDNSADNITWIFYSDGRYTATGNDLPDQNGRWTLSVSRVDGQDIEDGKLTIISTAFASIGLSQLEYKIATASLANVNKLYADTDASSWSSNPKNNIYLIFHKR